VTNTEFAFLAKLQSFKLMKNVNHRDRAAEGTLEGPVMFVGQAAV